MWLLIALACGRSEPATRALELEGVRVEVPTSFVDLEPHQVERLRNAALRQAPNQQVAVRGVRHPEAMARGMVHVQHSIDPMASAYGPTVGQALVTFEADLRQYLVASGVDVVGVESSERDGGREVCTRFRMGDGERTMTLSQCVLAAVDPSHRMQLWAVNCGAESEEACAAPMASRRYTPGEVLAPDVAFPPPPAPPGIAGVSGAEAWGVTFGASREAFRAACRAAGHEPDGIDEGRIAQCAGALAPLPPELGQVVQMNAMFDGADRLITASWFLAQPPEGVEAVLVRAWPDGRGMGQVVHLVDPNATGDAVLSASVAPSRTPGARTILVVTSRRGQDTAL